MGSKYTARFEGTGNLKSYLKDIEVGMGKTAAQAQKLNQGMGELNKEGDKLGSIASSSRGGALLELGEKLNAAGQEFLSFSGDVITASKKMVSDIIADASTFQDTQSSLQYAFGDNWENVFEKVKKEAANLTFTFDEVSSLASSMGRMKINPFGTDAEDLAAFKSKTGEAISALQILQDVSDATGRDTQALMFSIRNAMAGQMKSLKDAVDMPADAFKKLTDDIKKAKDPQEKYNVLIGQLGEYFGGAGLAKAKNWSKAVAQFPDLLQQIRAGVGAEGLKALTPAMFELVEAIGGLVKDKDAMKALSDAFLMVAEALAYMARIGVKAVGWLRDLLKAAPWIPKLAVALTLVAVAGSFVVGVLLVVAGIAATIAGTLALLTPEAILIGAAVALAIVPAFLLLAAVMAPVVLLAYAVGANLGKGAKTGMTALEKIKVVMEAIGELLTSFDGKSGKLTEGTAKKLKDAGLLDFVTDLFKIYYRVRVFFSSFADTISEIADRLAPVVLPMLEEMKSAFFELMDALGLSSAKTKMAGSDTKSWAEAGKQLADVLIKVVSGMVFLIRLGVQIFRIALQFKILHVIVGFLAINMAILATGIAFAVASAALFALPFILAGLAVTMLITKLYTLGKLIKEVLQGKKGFGEAISEFGASFVKDSGESMLKYAARQVTGIGGEEVLTKSTGTAPGGGTEAAYAKPGSDSVLPTGAALPEMPAMGADTGKTAAAVEKGNSLLQQVIAAIKENAPSVYIDSEQIVTAIKKKGVLTGGVD